MNLKSNKDLGKTSKSEIGLSSEVPNEAIQSVINKIMNNHYGAGVDGSDPGDDPSYAKIIVGHTKHTSA